MNKLKQNVTDFFVKHLEMNVPRYDDTFLKNTLQKRIYESGCGTYDEYFELLIDSQLENQIFVDALQISYSAFFRNPLTFNTLEKLIIPRFLEQKTNYQIRIWSAACAAGQEPYSLAMLLEASMNDDRKNNRYRIFASDRDENQIYLAQKGKFPASALNNMSIMLINKWFKREGEIYTVKPELKQKIDFSTFDLFDEKYSSPPSSIFGDFDIVFCANLLFYYKPESRKTIINKVIGSMAKEGLLITGETEREILLDLNFKEVYPGSAIFSLK